MKTTINSPKKTVETGLRSLLSSRFDLGQERYVGKVLGGFFRIAYYSGKEFGRRLYPIKNTLTGFSWEKDGQTEIRYFLFYGLTDPLSLISIYLGTLVVLAAALLSQDLSLKGIFLWALCWTAAIGALTFLISYLSESGRKRAEALKKLMKGNPSL